MNNYNTSTTGYNVEFTAFYDTDLSQCYFNENFISENNERSLLYTGGENITADDFILSVDDTPKNRAAILDAAGWDEEDGENFETCEDLACEVFYDYKTIHDKLTEYTNAGIDYSCNFSIMISSGYSQGDRRAVYVLNTEEHVTRDYIDQLLWGVPITARVEINGEDVLFEEDILGGDYYKWDADDARERITAALIKLEYSADCIAEVVGLIPANIDYN